MLYSGVICVAGDACDKLLADKQAQPVFAMLLKAITSAVNMHSMHMIIAAPLDVIILRDLDPAVFTESSHCPEALPSAEMLQGYFKCMSLFGQDINVRAIKPSATA